jgi:CubicO group peptidase (beta-lactamase class C family)
MASITKPFVATALMQLVEQGKVHLDDPVVKYLPCFALKDRRYKEITVRQMATHTSGMPDVRNYFWDKPEYDDGALERYVRSLGDKTLRFAPGITGKSACFPQEKAICRERAKSPPKLREKRNAERLSLGVGR